MGQAFSLARVALLAFVAATSSRAMVPSSERPDIVVILADDLGFSDLGCQGGEISTPNIDRLAAEGARFLAASNAARCCPSRAALLTGAYPHRVGMGWMTQVDLGRPAYRAELAANCSTLPEILSTAGYRTFMAGKWHLTAERESNGLPPKESWPTRRGFDGFYGILGGGGSYFSPRFLLRGETPVAPGPNYDFTAAITDAAVDFLWSQVPGPRFLYVAYTAPHWPLHAAEPEIARHLPIYAAGYQAIREGRLDRLRKDGILPSGGSAAPDTTPDWSRLSPAAQADQARRMAIYAAQVEAMDRGVGRILKAVRESGRDENTLVIFASDNGACAEELEPPPLPANLAATERSSYGAAWASISSLPFRGFKKDPLQGGVATPLFLRWPARIKPGIRIGDPVQLIDVLPTCADAAQATLPDERGGQEMIRPDGLSLLPAVLDGKPLPARDLFFEHEGGRAIRRGPLKALALRDAADWQLFDLETDPAELRDLAPERPTVLASMQTAWTHWAEVNGILPLDKRDWGDRTRDPRGGQSPPAAASPATDSPPSLHHLSE